MTKYKPYLVGLSNTHIAIMIMDLIGIKKMSSHPCDNSSQSALIILFEKQIIGIYSSSEKFMTLVLSI